MTENNFTQTMTATDPAVFDPAIRSDFAPIPAAPPFRSPRVR